MQARRKGAHLYTRCDDCGIDQRTGAAVQNRLFYGADWVDGAPPIPVNAGEPPGDAVADDLGEPITEAVTEPPTEAKPKPNRKKRGGLGWLLAGLGLIGVVLSVVIGGNGRELLAESQGGENAYRW